MHSRSLPTAHDPKTGLDFAEIPSGELSMGLRVGEEERLRLYAQVDDPYALRLTEWLCHAARPVHHVQVTSFLCARTPVSQELAQNLLGTRDETFDVPAEPWARLGCREAARLVALTGMRLLSEAEFEWVARITGNGEFINDCDIAHRALISDPWTRGDGAVDPEYDIVTSNAHGVVGLTLGEWVADGWHPQYVGAPADSRPWEASVLPRVVRGGAAMTYPWQRAHEIVAGHAAFRRPAEPRDRLVVRLATHLDAISRDY